MEGGKSLFEGLAPGNVGVRRENGVKLAPSELTACVQDALSNSNALR